MSSDAQLREIERAIDLDPERHDLIERFILLVRRSGGFSQGFPGDEDRERTSRRLAHLAGDRGTQLEVALRAFSIPFRKVRLVEGRSEWQFKLRSFNLDTDPASVPDFVHVDCAARVSEKPHGIDLAFHGDSKDCIFTGTSTRRLVDFLANPKTVPPIIGSNPEPFFRMWRRVETYRFHFNMSVLLGEAGDTHTGHNEPEQHLLDEHEAAGARLATWQTFTLRRRSIDFQADWKHSWCYGEFQVDDHSSTLDPRVVNSICLTARNGETMAQFGGGPVHPGMLHCVDTQEAQFWTAADLVEAADAFVDVWEKNDECSSPEEFMRCMKTLGFTDDSTYSWFTRDKYDGHRFVCGYTAPDRTHLELEFVETNSETVQAKLWAERPDDSAPVYAVLRTPRELFERLRGMFQVPGGVVF